MTLRPLAHREIQSVRPGILALQTIPSAEPLPMQQTVAVDHVSSGAAVAVYAGADPHAIATTWRTASSRAAAIHRPFTRTVARFPIADAYATRSWASSHAV
jgi:hypothetical protein